MKNIFKKNHIIITALAIMIVIAGYLSFTNKDTAENTETAVTANPDTDEYGAFTEVDGLDVVTNTDTDTTVTGTEPTEVDTTVTTTDDTNTAAATAAGKDETAQGVTEDNTGDVSQNDISDDDILATAQDVTDNGELNLEEGVPGEAVLASTTLDTSYFISSKVDREQVRSKSRETLMQIVQSVEASDKAKEKATDSLIEMTAISEKESATEILLEAKGFDGAMVYIVGEDVNVVVNAEAISDQQLAIIEEVVKENTDITVDHIHINTVVVAE